MDKGNRHFGDAREGQGFKGRRMYDVQECIFQFTAKTIPSPIRLPPHINRERLQLTEWESENGKQRSAIHPDGIFGIPLALDRNGSDKRYNDWIFDEEFINPLAKFVAFEGNSGEQLLATREKE